MPTEPHARMRFILSSLLGLSFFALPVPVAGRWTVLFDLTVQTLTRNLPTGVGVYCLALILTGAAGTALAAFNPTLPEQSTRWSWLSGFHASHVFAALRLASVPLAAMMFLRIGPGWLLGRGIAHLMWNTLVFSVGVIIPIGAVALSILVSYGCLEFVGTLMRPIMRPLFRLPGRAALDDLTSWIGSYSVALYLTRSLALKGRYSRREAFTIATCFSTVSIGFVGVVAATLDLLHLFPLILITYFAAIHLTAALLVRFWPYTSVPDTYLTRPDPEPEDPAAWAQRWSVALSEAMRRAAKAPSFARVAANGFTEGLTLASTILGTILTVGTAAMLLAEHTEVFAYAGRPLAPILDALGLPDAATLGPASVAGITEMYIPALLARDAAVQGRFFICVLSISQLIFFSSVGPMMMDMFREIPIRFHHLVALFFIRTAILIPLLAAFTWALALLGVFGPA